ncbi:phage protein [Roseibium sp. TrichSKD4]|uniref:phage protein Gp27 family protein n=1 Tax=Roseibium sp. TrichSKD4 TaxID=744980 RepID=UPI0001E57069|nr:phage protein Gp27 family protein [Roseibium sp. TrichSKD4]EFO31662.1 phage protein [Roseibium sp. TrichSKD4]
MAGRNKKTRGRLSSIDLLPEECSGIVSWAAAELVANNRTLVDIYAEFRDKLIALQGELGIGFDIPSFSSFHRHSARKTAITQELAMRRDIYSAVADGLSAKDSDDLTIFISETVKTLIAAIAEEAITGRATTSAKDIRELANAAFKIEQARNLSGHIRRTDEDEVNQKLGKAIDTAGKKVGLSGERVDQLKREFLGVREQQADQDGG